MNEKRLKEIPIVELRNILMLIGLYLILSVMTVIHVSESMNEMYNEEYLSTHSFIMVVMLIVATIVHMKYPRDKFKLGYVSSGMYFVLYSYTLMTSSTIGVYVYIIPFLILLLIYDDTVLLLSTSIIAACSTVSVFLVKSETYDTCTGIDVEIAIACLILTIVFLLMSRLSVLRAFNRMQKLEKELLEDTLTGCNNRKFLEQLVDNGFFNKKGVSVILGDINNFKQINDNYGHINGDIALICVGKVLRDVCDKYDNTWEIRIGGDEFIIVTDKEFTDEIIKECKEAYKKDETIRKLGFSLVISFGQAKNETGKMSWQQLYDLADQRMYEQKEEYKRCQ